MDLPRAGQFVGSDAQAKLLKRGHKSLVYGRCANGDTWDMPVANREGILKYKKAAREEREAKAGGAPRRPDPPRREPAGIEKSSHSHSNCPDCLALHECTLSRDNAFNARVNMLISRRRTGPQRDNRRDPYHPQERERPYDGDRGNRRGGRGGRGNGRRY